MASYTTRSTSVTVTIELGNTPQIPVRYSKFHMFAGVAVVSFELEDVLIFEKIELKGSRALKAGGPSNSPSSTWYWAGCDSDTDIPVAVQAVINYARAQLLERLK